MEANPFQEYREHAGACDVCGNSPVNHIGAYCVYTASILLDELRTYLGKNPARQLTGKSRLARIRSRVDPLIYGLALTIGLIGTSDDVMRARTYRSQVIWEEAKRRGIHMEQLTFLNSFTDEYRVRFPNGWFYFESIPTPPHMEPSRTSWIDDKLLLKRILREAGIPTPRIISARSEAEAQEAFRTLATPVVVKPRSGSRARHTTTNVRTSTDVRDAFRIAQQICRYVVLEEHLAGNVCRGTLVNGKLAGFFEAKVPHVTGDGNATIANLIATKNAHKHPRVQDIVITKEHLAFIARQGYTLDSQLPAGVSIPLTHRTGRLFGGETRELLGSVHSLLREYLERAANLLGIPIVGFDLIIEDPEKSPDEQRWGIIEANTLPFIDLHYLPLHGEPSNVAAAVWDLWESTRAL